MVQKMRTTSLSVNPSMCIAMVIFLFAALNGCQKSVPPGRYFEAFEKQQARYTVEISRNGVLAELSYNPNELYAARDMQADTGLSASTALQRYENSLFLLLKITVQNENQSGNSLKRKMNIAAHDVSGDIFLENSKDTVPVVTCRYEPNLGIGNPDAFILAFPRTKLKRRPQEYNLVIRNISPELGTLEFGLNKVIKKTLKLRG